MADYQLLKIPEDYRIVVLEQDRVSKLPQEVIDEVEAMWKRETKHNPHLFNGKLFSMLKHDQQHMEGVFVEYKHFIAQLKQSKLKEILKIKPVCVSAVVHTPTAVLIGKRSKTVLQNPGCYELVPAGGVDADSVNGMNEIDIQALVLRELEEEANIKKDKIESIVLTGLVWDPVESTMEFIVNIMLDDSSSSKEIQPNSHEHTQLLWVDKRKLSNFIRENKDIFVPFSLYLINYVLIGLP